ncbi:NAD(P)-binding protein [Rhizopogon salebrosus TDB-379]|nr:NAD(P)-binding protein [Rhizopogon salebrosus TDB-379]
MAGRTPEWTRALVLRQCSAEAKPVYHDTVLENRPLPQLKHEEVLVKINAASFNRRDLWIRLGQYPGIKFGSVIGADGAGTVLASPDANDVLLNKRVFLAPTCGWESHPDAPEASESETDLYNPSFGTFADYVIVKRSQVIRSPDHLDDVQISARPIGGLAAWRVTIVKARVSKDQNILITGIGGGVALLAMQLCLAKGANVYVTSSSKEKISRATSLGAKGGVNYKSKDWPSRLAALLAKICGKPTKIDTVIDSGGSDIMTQVNSILKHGGKVVVYGMTANPRIKFTMREVLKNQQLIGSTMGSLKDLTDATQFLSEHRIVPVVSHVLDGLEAADEGFELLKRGDQFGKFVLKIDNNASAKL